MICVEKLSYRILMLLAFCWIAFSGLYSMFLYGAVLLICLELLNTQTWYAEEWRSLNYLFTGYLFFILTIRTGHWDWNPLFREFVNVIEHLLFAVVVCLLLYLGSLAFKARAGFFPTLLFVFIIFNLTGIANEVYQNLCIDHQALLFEPESTKDILVNFIGSFVGVYIIFSLAKKLWKKKAHIFI